MIEYIDIDKVLQKRIPKQYKYLPRFVVGWVEKIIHQKDLNSTLDAIGDAEGVDAARRILEHLEIKTDEHGVENIPASGRFLFVSNHPLGGLDGIVLISLLGGRYGGAIKFLVNDLLMAVKPLRKVFLPVNKYGRQSRVAANEIEQEYAGDNQMITFPAGLCSRRLAGGKIGDLPWQKSAITMAVRYKRDIIPIHFDAVNSKRFYRLARWRERLGIKFNYEMILLPGEVYKSRGKTFRVVFGQPIRWQELDARNAGAEAQRIRDLIYEL